MTMTICILHSHAILYIGPHKQKDHLLILHRRCTVCLIKKNEQNIFSEFSNEYYSEHFFIFKKLFKKKKKNKTYKNMGKKLGALSFALGGPLDPLCCHLESDG